MNNRDLIVELKRKYEQTYLFVQNPLKDTERLMFCRAIETDGENGGQIDLTSRSTGTILLNIPSEMNLLFRYPKTGVFQHGCNAYRYQRNPVRQWKRGICNGNSTLLVLRATPRGVSLNEQLVEAAFAQKTLMYREALRMLQGKKAVSVALANNFWLSLYPTTKPVYVLYHNEIPVAAVNSDSGEVHKMLSEAFTENVREITQG